MKNKSAGSREKLLAFFLANIGRVIESQELQEAADYKSE